VTLTLDIVTFEFPLFVSVTLCEALVPSVTFPKLRFVGLTTSDWVAATPVPLREIKSGEFGPVLTRETDPRAFPAEVGANKTLNVVLAPAPIVAGVESPLVLKPEPETFICEIVTLAVPVFFRLIDWESVFPVTALPKLTLAGVGDSCASIPSPARTIANGDPGALLVIAILPLALPLAVGANLALKVAVLPASMVSGGVIPLMLKPLPMARAPEIVTLPVPELVSAIA
jgi:hypothetical protein